MSAKKSFTEENPFDASLTSFILISTHKCGYCKRLSPLSDDLGGCAKVRALSIGIEDFDFIKCGYETFHTKTNIFVVLECKNYIKD